MATKGRPTKYKKEYCEQARKLCLKGFIDKDLAEFFEVNVDTIYEWKKKHQEFSDALKEGKHYSDDKVVDALYNRALGFEVVETKEEVGDSGKKTTTITKQVSGDTTAQIFWLKNRQPTKWRDKQEVETTGSQELNINFNIPRPNKDTK